MSAVDATAEITGLEAASIDMVAVGRAFHWFDQARALAEFKRILKRGAWVVLVSQRRAQEGASAEGLAQAREYEGILRGGYRGWRG